MAAVSRHISFEACFNFRDLGGYRVVDGRRVRWRRLFRSMTPEHMTERDIERARALRIALVIDLRGPDAPGSGPLSLPPSRRLAVAQGRASSWTSAHENVFREAPPEMALPMTLERGAVGFAQAVAALAEVSKRNALVHCRLGKDRTGVLSALLLKLFGVSDSDVIADYMYSAAAEGQARRLLQEVGHPPPANESRLAREPASRRAIVALLARVHEQHGTARHYFEETGVPGSALDGLVSDLLE